MISVMDKKEEATALQGNPAVFVEETDGDVTATSVSTVAESATYTKPTHMEVTMPNRAQRRANDRKDKKHLTKKVRRVRGKVLYGGQEITGYYKFGFKDPITMVKMGLMGILPKDLLNLKLKEEKGKDFKEAEVIKE